MSLAPLLDRIKELADLTKQWLSGSDYAAKEGVLTVEAQWPALFVDDLAATSFHQERSGCHIPFILRNQSKGSICKSG
jgi:hypothetical protein